MHIAVRGASSRKTVVRTCDVRPSARLRSSLWHYFAARWTLGGDNAMDATPTLIWSTRRVVGKDFTALAVPRNRRSITANDTPIPTPRGPVVR